MADADPSQEELRALHEALLAGDPTASATAATLLLPALRRRFAGRHDLDRADIDSLVGLSIAAYIAEPERYDPDKGPLLPYLYRDVDGDIGNEVAKRARRPETPRDTELLELKAVHGNPTPEDEVVDRLDSLDLPRETVEAALEEVGGLSEEDREFLLLRAEGVRDTHTYAAVLGIAHLPVAQGRRAVKRAKDRLDKRLERIRDRLNG
ncbi:MAG: hypothetical protein ACRDN9_10025 [Streptosporangiaceae bacterium]